MFGATVTQRRIQGGGASMRDRYLDSLRALALVRVIFYHMFAGAWLTFAFPAMGVMFAMAGSLMARSMDRPASRVVASRIRRLLPALWVLGIALIPAMIWSGWNAWGDLVLWVFPVAQPSGTKWAEPATIGLWYLVTYLWLVLMSPAALWFYRRRPVLTTLFPLALLLALHAPPPFLSERATDVVTDVATFAACWIIGFAHRDGSLRSIALPGLLALAALSMAIGAGWALTHGKDGLDLNDIPVAQGFYSVGFVLLLLRAAPTMAWLSRSRVLDRLVTLLNARAVTVYLWHNIAIAVCFVVGDRLHVWRLGTTFEDWGYLAVALALLTVPLLLVGWVEDVAARRPPRLLPWRPVRPTRRPAAAPAGRTAPANSP